MAARGLKKALGLLDVYAVATGATLSTGFFLLPGLAAVSGGTAIPSAYLVAGLCLVPGILSQIELATAMPRAGGIYYFVDRSMGPLPGTVAGLGTWITLILKSAFALVGIGAYLALYFPEVPTAPIAVTFAVGFGVLNLFGVEKVGSFQLVLTGALLLVLGSFILMGLPRAVPSGLGGVFNPDMEAFLSTVGLVVVSFMGLIKVASLSEEVRDPERNIPLGVALAFLTALVAYVVGTWVMVSVVGVEALTANGGDLTPAATLAETLWGPVGVAVMTLAAIVSFSSVANAGILSASRYPWAMARDHILPRALRLVSPWRTPHVAIFATVALVVGALTLFDPTHIAELAGAFALIMFAMSCLAVVVMRESRIPSYDPGFRSPFYPWIQILGLLLPFPIILEMGWLATLLSGGFITVGILWYTYYARERVGREGAIFHVFERLGRQRDLGLERELREILKEKGLRAADPFEELISKAPVIDLPGRATFTEAVDRVSEALSGELQVPPELLSEGFVDCATAGVAPMSHGAILTHLRLPTLPRAAIVLVRAAEPIEVDVAVGWPGPEPEEPIRAGFFLASPETDPGQHLRILAQIAGRVDDESFLEEWSEAGDEQELREVMLRDERMCVLDVLPDDRTRALIGNAIQDLSLPETTLVAMIRRGSEFVVPHGSTTIEAGDRITILGEPQGIIDLRHRFEDHH